MRPLLCALILSLWGCAAMTDSSNYKAVADHFGLTHQEMAAFVEQVCKQHGRAYDRVDLVDAKTIVIETESDEGFEYRRVNGQWEYIGMTHTVTSY